MKENIIMWPYNGVALDGNTIWFVAFEYSVLVQYNLELKRIEKIIFWEDSSRINDSHYNIVCFGDNVILVPGWSKRIIVYNKKTEDVKSIELEDSAKRMEMFSEVAVWDGKVFFFPIEYGKIVRFDCSNMQVCYYDVDMDKKNENIFTGSSQQIDNMVYIKLFGSQNLYVYDMQTQNGKIVNVPLKNSYNLLCPYNNKSLLLIDKIGVLWSLDCTDFSVDMIFETKLSENIVRGIRSKDCYIFFSKYIEDDIVILKDKDVRRINLAQFGIEKYKKYDWEYTEYSRPVADNNKVITFDMSRRMMCIIDIEDYSLEMKYIEYSKENCDGKVYADRSNYTEVVKETNVYDLSVYLENLKK